MAKHLTLNVKTGDEFFELIKGRDIRISRSVVQNILDVIHSKKRFVYVLEVIVESTQSTFDWSISREEFYNVLEKNLLIH